MILASGIKRPWSELAKRSIWGWETRTLRPGQQARRPRARCRPRRARPAPSAQASRRELRLGSRFIGTKPSSPRRAQPTTRQATYHDSHIAPTHRPRPRQRGRRLDPPPLPTRVTRPGPIGVGVTTRSVRNRTLSRERLVRLVFHSRSFAERSPSNGGSWAFSFQNPLSESLSKASTI